MDMTTSVDPNFKSSLAPRKRARTSEEKEQRRMERILRNRRAAHASREKKRRHVEYLEAYVLSLEKNYSTVLSNVSKLKDMLPSDKLPVSLAEPEDLSDLKSKIHANLSFMTSADPSSPSVVCDTPHSESSKGGNGDELESPQMILDSVKVKVEEPDSPLMNAKPAMDYHSYLSPVSINSPRTSPIDLTIKKEPLSPSFGSLSSPSVPFPNSDGLMFESATLGPDYSAQNSAVILSLSKITRHSDLGGSRSVRA
ncbi:hypothetical protein OXX80_009433 [Metschnikowia pulcherrima]